MSHSFTLHGFVCASAFEFEGCYGVPGGGSVKSKMTSAAKAKKSSMNNNKLSQ